MNQEQWRSFKLSVNIITEKKASNERLSENGKTSYNNIKQWESSKTLQQITKDNSSAHILWFFCYFYYSIACCCNFYWFFSRHKSLLLLFLLLLAILYFILYFLYLIMMCTLCWIVQCSRFAQFDKGARATRIDRVRAYQVWALFVFTMIVHVWIRCEKISRFLSCILLW